MLDQVRIFDLPSVADDRGTLTAVESRSDIPFSIARIFYMHHVKADRGGHAHKDTDQVLIAIAGEWQVDLFDGRSMVSYHMNDPTKGLYVPREVFIELSRFTNQAVCLVLASDHYDMSRSLRNRADYIAYMAQTEQGNR